MYLSHLSGPWALKVLRVINNLGRKGCTYSTVEHTKCAKYYRHEKSKVKSVVLVITAHSLCSRLMPIMLLKLPMILWSNAPEFCLLCSNYAPYVSWYVPQIQYFLSFIVLKSQNHEYHWFLFTYFPNTVQFCLCS